MEIQIYFAIKKPNSQPIPVCHDISLMNNWGFRNTSFIINCRFLEVSLNRWIDLETVGWGNWSNCAISYTQFPWQWCSKIVFYVYVIFIEKKIILRIKINKRNKESFENRVKRKSSTLILLLVFVTFFLVILYIHKYIRIQGEF